MSEEKSYSHIDFEKRCLIEKLLNAGMNLSYIANKINLPLSSVTREVKRNRRDDGHTKFKRLNRICVHRRNCAVRALCKEKHCRNRKCSTCEAVLCSNLCEYYTPEVCTRTLKAPYCCNGCLSAWGCVLHRYRYDAKCAQRMADGRLKETRSGINCTEDEFAKIIDIVKPLLAQKVGLDAIWCAHQDELGISKRTFYRWADLGLGVCNMDLPKKVSYRPRKSKETICAPRADIAGKTYKDFLKLKEEVRMSAWEMDCVKGLRTDKKVILTLLHKRTHFQFGILLESHTSDKVVSALNWVESICEGKFGKLFSVILTDRGHEFSNVFDMEHSLDDKKRSSVYFCDPQRPDQKGQCERAHVELRKILPKKRTSFDALTPWDISSIFSHINSLPRPSLGGVSPLELAMAIFPKRLFEELGLSLIEIGLICLKPDLLNKKDSAD